ncbi:MAG: hypothetical protein DRP78_06750, partial [Candidatus Omnitrophota bacterium]
PFLFLAICEGLFLSLWYYSPRPIVSIVLAPIIRAFMGEQFLHYPLNFLVLPKLISISRVIIYFGLGLVTLSMTISAVFQLEVDKSVSWFFGNFNRALRQYPIFLLWSIIYGLGVLVCYKAPLFFVAKFQVQTNPFPAYLPLLCSFVMLVFVETIFIYLPVTMLIQGKTLLAKVKEALRFSFRFFVSTVFFVFIIRCLKLLMFLLRIYCFKIIEKFFPQLPEFTLIVLSLEIFVFFLANCFLTITAAEFYLLQSQEAKE